jgi:outer membrane protein assembly factor BamD (BamD/ComL family)
VTSGDPVASAPASARLDVGLEDQVAAIDRARAALERGDAAECLAKLASYDRSFPDGMLSQEATLLRVQALVQRGDRVAARDVAARFIASHPASPHEQRIRRLLETNP